jgi:hypothetical protein
VGPRRTLARCGEKQRVSENLAAIEVDHDNSNAGQLALMTALVTGVAKRFKLLLPNGNTATFTVYVKKFNSQGAVEQAIRRSAELRISGSITWV